MSRRTRAYFLRLAAWVVLGTVLCLANLWRGAIDLCSISVGNGEVRALVFPSAIGGGYWPEVYSSGITIHSFDYASRPLQMGGPFEGFSKGPDSPAPFGNFAFHYVNNGGVHWTISGGMPLWFLILLLTIALAFFRVPKGLQRTKLG